MFEKASRIQLPRTVAVGHGVLEDAAEVIGALHLHGRPLVVTSPTPRTVAADRLLEQFESGDLDPALIVVEKASFDSVERVLERARDVEAGYLVGVGGGKAIDIAKMASDTLQVGFVSVPTAASHDGIVSGRGSVPDGDTRHSVAAGSPVAVIGDTTVLADAPWELTTAGCADIISNYTAVKDWRLANRLKGVPYSEYSGALAEMTAEMLVDNADLLRPNLEESAWIVLKALVSSGVAMSIADSSRPASGAEHLFSHQLDRIAAEPALHGHQVGVGTVLVEYLHSGPDGDWHAVRDALAQIGAPTTASELGVSDEEVIEALATAHEIRDRYTILGDGVDTGAAREIAEQTDVV